MRCIVGLITGCIAYYLVSGYLEGLLDIDEK